MTAGKTVILELAERYCVCTRCCPGMCESDCPNCSVEKHSCQCVLCPQGPCDPECRHLNCSEREASRAEARMDTKAGLLRWNRVIHETRIREFHQFEHERGASFTLVSRNGQRTHRTGQELEAIAFRAWLLDPASRTPTEPGTPATPKIEPPKMEPGRLDRYIRRHDLKLRRTAGEFNAGPRRHEQRETRIRLGLHEYWGRIGPTEHGWHANWGRKVRRDGLRAENKLHATAAVKLTHISLHQNGHAMRSITQCGLTRESAVCVPPGDRRSGPTLICPSCMKQADWREKESQAA